ALGSYNHSLPHHIEWIHKNVDKALLRGGSWIYDPNICRSAIRSIINRRDVHFNSFGFRVVCDVGITL
ncbi:formylglycine-generating enzyme family protein, partial [Dapis sp. BLCC M229]